MFVVGAELVLDDDGRFSHLLQVDVLHQEFNREGNVKTFQTIQTSNNGLVEKSYLYSQKLVLDKEWTENNRDRKF